MEVGKAITPNQVIKVPAGTFFVSCNDKVNHEDPVRNKYKTQIKMINEL